MGTAGRIGVWAGIVGLSVFGGRSADAVPQAAFERVVLANESPLGDSVTGFRYELIGSDGPELPIEDGVLADPSEPLGACVTCAGGVGHAGGPPLRPFEPCRVQSPGTDATGVTAVAVEVRIDAGEKAARRCVRVEGGRVVVDTDCAGGVPLRFVRVAYLGRRAGQLVFDLKVGWWGEGTGRCSACVATGRMSVPVVREDPGAAGDPKPLSPVVQARRLPDVPFDVFELRNARKKSKVKSATITATTSTGVTMSVVLVEDSVATQGVASPCLTNGPCGIQGSGSGWKFADGNTPSGTGLAGTRGHLLPDVSGDACRRYFKAGLPTVYMNVVSVRLDLQCEDDGGVVTTASVCITGDGPPEASPCHEAGECEAPSDGHRLNRVRVTCVDAGLEICRRRCPPTCTSDGLQYVTHQTLCTSPP